MAKWVASHADKLEKDGEKEAIVAALSAQAQLRSQVEADKKDVELIQKGIGLINKNCANGCHRFGNDGALGLAPDLTGYGSYEWMLAFVSDPMNERYYGNENDRMPSFAQNLHDPLSHAVSIRELSLIVDWLRGDYYEPSDAQPVLPHTEEHARQVVMLNRLITAPKTAIVGASLPPAETATDRAERLFRENCSACHQHMNEHGKGIHAVKLSAPNLYGFASREWLAGLLDPERIASKHYFGNTAHAGGDMVGFVKDNLADLDDDKKEALQDVIAALSAEASLPAQAEADAKAKSDGVIEKGKTALDRKFACVDCHKFHNNGEAEGPDLTGYGSREWLTRMISNPANPDFYGEHNDRMPAFVAKPPPHKANLLSDDDLLLLVRWLRGEDLSK
jgi:ubiquinol-cytochrome c reductase cytochrome b subunit